MGISRQESFNSPSDFLDFFNGFAVTQVTIPTQICCRFIDPFFFRFKSVNQFVTQILISIN